MRRLLAGACTGFVAGYALFRSAEAILDTCAPRPPIEPDARRYGAYRRATMVAGIARSLATNAAAAFVFAGLLPERLRRDRTWLGAAAYFALGTIADTLLETPTDFVEDFTVERRYGLSDRSAGAWLEDRAKGLGVSLAIGTPLATGLIAIARRFPDRWPLAAAAAIPPLMVLANLFVPVYVAPLFNTFAPLEGPIERRLRALAARYGVGDADILRFDMSKQTKKANAYVTGLFGTHRIVIADTLLDGFEADEIEFVVAHELGHYVGRDVWIGVGAGSLAGAGLIFAAHALTRRTTGAPNVTTLPDLQIFGFYLTLLGTLAGPLSAAASRDLERRADRFAARAVARPQAGIAAFERLREMNLAEDEQPRWAETLFASHPSLKSRIAALQGA